MTFLPDPAVADFTTSLSPLARRHYQGQLAQPDVLKALSLGWAPHHLAKLCSDNLPVTGAWAVIHSRLANAAKQPPAELRQKKASPYAHQCNHLDGHICPWVDQPDGTVQRCKCEVANA